MKMESSAIIVSKIPTNYKMGAIQVYGTVRSV
jgi:hypothetical protein